MDESWHTEGRVMAAYNTSPATTPTNQFDE